MCVCVILYYWSSTWNNNLLQLFKKYFSKDDDLSPIENLFFSIVLLFKRLLLPRFPFQKDSNLKSQNHVWKSFQKHYLNIIQFTLPWAFLCVMQVRQSSKLNFCGPTTYIKLKHQNFYARLLIYASRRTWWSIKLWYHDQLPKVQKRLSHQ